MFGFYPKIGDSGTVGSVAWSDLAAWKHGDIRYIQDIVEQSRVRAAQDAVRWTFAYPQPVLVPGTNRIFIARNGYRRDGGLLEARISPRTGH